MAVGSGLAGSGLAGQLAGWLAGGGPGGAERVTGLMGLLVGGDRLAGRRRRRQALERRHDRQARRSR